MMAGMPHSSDGTVQRKTTDGEYFAYLNDDESDQKYLHLSVRKLRQRPAKRRVVADETNLRPTAAFFRSDRHIKKAVAAIAMPAKIMDPVRVNYGALSNLSQSRVPKFARCLPWLSDMPVKSHPLLNPGALDPLRAGDSEKSYAGSVSDRMGGGRVAW
jgi:hypothetical protein